MNNIYNRSNNGKRKKKKKRGYIFEGTQETIVENQYVWIIQKSTPFSREV